MSFAENQKSPNRGVLTYYLLPSNLSEVQGKGRSGQTSLLEEIILKKRFNVGYEVAQGYRAVGTASREKG